MRSIAMYMKTREYGVGNAVSQMEQMDQMNFIDKEATRIDDYRLPGLRIWSAPPA